MRFKKLTIHDFRHFFNQEIFIGNQLTAIAGNNGTGKSTILGLLANSSQLQGHKTYLEKPYRGEFSELFSASPEYQPSGQTAEILYEESGEKKTISFRTGWQQGYTRFRIIPRAVLPDGSISEAKLKSPVIYLGLSRLYPIGEAEPGTVRSTRQGWDQEDDRIWFEKQYKKILSLQEDLKSLSRLGIVGLSAKAGTGVETDTYGPSSNSSGQDDLGQILMAVLSFKKLKREFKAEWDGGLLLIDEVDATLHPAAQRRLVDLLKKEAKETGFQVVFTTHSTVILEEIASKCSHNPPDEAGDIEIAYLTDASRSLKVYRNPTWPYMESDLLIKGSWVGGAKVAVFSEDDEACWFAERILEALYPAMLERVSFLEISFGWKQLLRLYRDDYLYLRDRIVLLDGDVADVEIESRVPEMLLRSGQNIVRLPGSLRPESILHNFLLELPEEDPLWCELECYGFTFRVLVDEGPDSDTYASDGEERRRYKSWFRNCSAAFEAARIVRRWVELNAEEAREFVESFVKAYNAVAKRTTAPEIPMLKRVENV